jgi:hypothetical protein
MLSGVGKLLILLGLGVAAMGLLLVAAERLGWLGRLPGDIVIERKNFTFYFPVVTCLVLSVIVTLILWVLNGRR